MIFFQSMCEQYIVTIDILCFLIILDSNVLKIFTILRVNCLQIFEKLHAIFTKTFFNFYLLLYEIRP